jgi:hypothetical protein
MSFSELPTSVVLTTNHGTVDVCLILWKRMKFFFFVAVLAVSFPSGAAGQQSIHASLAPMRAEAKKAFTAEMDRAAKASCPGLLNSAAVNECYEKALAQSASHLREFRAASRASIEARQDLFEPRFLNHFESAEQASDSYCVEQAQVTADIVDNPGDRPGSAAATRIDLIRSHMRMLDKIYNILLHNNCGACLTDQ